MSATDGMRYPTLSHSPATRAAVWFWGTGLSPVTLFQSKPATAFGWALWVSWCLRCVRAARYAATDATTTTTNPWISAWCLCCVGYQGHEETRIDARALQFLKDESIAFETQEYMAALATDEKERETELFHRGEQQAHAHSPQQPMESSMDSDMPNSPESSSQRCRYTKRILLFF